MFLQVCFLLLVSIYIYIYIYIYISVCDFLNFFGLECECVYGPLSPVGGGCFAFALCALSLTALRLLAFMLLLAFVC